jgi:hypothetical protein
MIGLLIPLRWWRGAGAPTYVDAPADRYVWAPPQNEEFEAAPWFYGFTADSSPVPLVAESAGGEVAAAEFHGFVAVPPGGVFTA